MHAITNGHRLRSRILSSLDVPQDSTTVSDLIQCLQQPSNLGDKHVESHPLYRHHRRPQRRVLFHESASIGLHHHRVQHRRSYHDLAKRVSRSTNVHLTLCHSNSMIAQGRVPRLHNHRSLLAHEGSPPQLQCPVVATTRTTNELHDLWRNPNGMHSSTTVQI